MKIKRYINLIVGLSFLAVAVVLWAMPTDSNSAPDNVARSARVLLDRVRLTHSRPSARFAGVTQAKNRAVLSFAVPARVARRLVESGSRVQAGQILARLEDGEFRNALDLARASVNELEAQATQAKRDLQRIRKLYAAHVATVSDLEKTETRQAALEASLQAARARMKESRRVLDETVLRAPFNGTITALKIQAGEWAVPGRGVMELTGDGPVELLVEVR